MLGRTFLRAYRGIQRSCGDARMSSYLSSKLNTSKKPSIEEWFQYSKVIVSQVPNSFVQDALRFEEPKEPIDLSKAKTQNSNYVEQLRKLVPEVIEIEPDAKYPDMVFVEDPAVVLSNRALICKIGHPSRRGEAAKMKEILESINVETFDLDKMDSRATMDGGDVLFTGREFLVGISGRTNKYGVEALARVFPEWPVTGVHVNPEVLHLKSMSSMAGVDLIAMGDTPAGRRAWKEIEQNASFKYNKLFFPDENGANCLFINGTILHISEDEYPESHKVWQTLDAPRIELPNSEMSKADGSLTCCSVRIN